MDVRGEVASLSVQEAMKILNMTKFTAEELNKKFQYRVQSITRGLGGSLANQKSVYTAWEYLNRMLARETSNQTEEVLKKVDQTVKMLEKPKQLDVIPVRLKNMSKKASLIIQKDTDSERRHKSQKLGVPTNPVKNKADKTEEGQRQDPERSLGVSALPGKLLQKHMKWMAQDQQQNEEVSNKQQIEDKTKNQKGVLAQLNTKASRRPKKDPMMLQLREIIRMDQTVRSSTEDRGKRNKQVELRKKLEKLPKLPRTQSQALLFKRTAALNEIFQNPRKPSTSDQLSSVKKAAWKEKVNQILSEQPGSAKRPKSGSKIKSRKAARRSVSKQPVEQMLYRTPDSEQKATKKPTNETKQLLKDNARPTGDPKLLANGLFTPSRILKWISAHTSVGIE